MLYGDSAVKILDEMAIDAGCSCFPLHWHERMELLLLLAGELVFQVGDKHGTAKVGGLVIIPPGRAHSGYAGENGVRYRTIMFDVSRFYNATAAGSKFLEPVVGQTVDFVPVSYDTTVVETVRALLSEQLSGDAFSPLITVGRVYELLGLLYRSCLCENAPPPPDDRLKNVLEYMEQHFRENISSATLSRIFGYDEAYFCRRFKSVTGLRPMTYLQILRLEYAKKQMKKGKTEMAELAEESGFFDAGYFSRCFKRHYGMTPTAYMLSHKTDKK